MIKDTTERKVLQQGKCFYRKVDGKRIIGGSKKIGGISESMIPS